MAEAIDTLNRHAVALRGDAVIMLMPPERPLTRIEAFTLAAWLIAMAECLDAPADAPTFQAVLDAVNNA